MAVQTKPQSSTTEFVTLDAVLETESAPQERQIDFKIFSHGLEITKAASSSDGKTRIKCIASSSIEDRHGDTITEACIRGMAKQAKGLTIFLNHSYEVPKDVFGHTESARVKRMTATEAKEKGVLPEHITLSSGETFAFLELDVVVNETNPPAASTVAALESGVTLGVSIGAMILDYTEKDGHEDDWFPPLIINEVELLEASVVGIPANPLSWVEGATKAIAIQKGLLSKRADRRDLERFFAKAEKEGDKDNLPDSAEELSDHISAGEGDDADEAAENTEETQIVEEEGNKKAIAPNITQDDPPAIARYYSHLMHDDLSDEDEVEKPTRKELEVLVRDALMAWKNAHPTDAEMDEMMNAIDTNTPLEEAETVASEEDAEAAQEAAAETESDPETAEGDPEEKVEATAADLIESGAIRSLKDAGDMLDQVFKRLVEEQAKSAALVEENATLKGQLKTAREGVSLAVDFVNKVLDTPLVRKSSVKSEATGLSARLKSVYEGAIPDLSSRKDHE